MYLLEEHIDLNMDLPQGFVFDIETTGLSPSFNRVVMITYAYQDKKQWVLRQEMAEEDQDESLLLLNFCQLSKNFLYAVHYNGQSFDLPFINKRLEYLALAQPFDKRRGFDLYLYLRKEKTKGSLKLLDQEKRAGFHRKDSLSGKDWVHLFNQFKKNKLKAQRKDLLLHNKEDVLGTLAILKKEKNFQDQLLTRLYKNALILDAYPGKDEIRIFLYDGTISTLDIPALSYDNLLFSTNYSNDWSAAEKRSALLAYGKKCFYENIKTELQRINYISPK